MLGNVQRNGLHNGLLLGHGARCHRTHSPRRGSVAAAATADSAVYVNAANATCAVNSSVLAERRLGVIQVLPGG